MTNSLLSALLAAFLISAAPLYAAEPDMLELLPRLLSRAPVAEKSTFKATRGPKKWEVSYCPDNTCDVIRAPQDTPRDAIADFSLLYLYYASGYIYLKPFYQTDAKSRAATVLSRRSNNCSKSSEFAMASCALTTLAVEYKISLAFRRSDEGKTGEEALKLEDTLTASRIAETKQWQLDAWKRYK